MKKRREKKRENDEEEDLYISVLFTYEPSSLYIQLHLCIKEATLFN